MHTGIEPFINLTAILKGRSVHLLDLIPHKPIPSLGYKGHFTNHSQSEEGDPGQQRCRLEEVVR